MLDLHTLLTQCMFIKRLSTIIGKLAARLVENGLVKGDWVLLQNCHLSISWMPDLEKIVEDFEPEKIHKDFRLW